jgi:hypothetical protein
VGLDGFKLFIPLESAFGVDASLQAFSSTIFTDFWMILNYF